MDYEEFFHVPSSSTDADLLTYVDMLTHYVNISNATLINVTATYGKTEEWLEQRRVYFGRPTDSPPPAPPPTDGNPPVERPFLFDEKGVRLDIPQLDHDNDIQVAYTDDTDDTDYKMRYVTSTKLEDRYTFAGKERGDPEKMPKDYFHRAVCGDEEATLIKVHVRILLQPHTFVDSRTDFFMRVYGGTIDAAFKRFEPENFGGKGGKVGTGRRGGWWTGRGVVGGAPCRARDARTPPSTPLPPDLLLKCGPTQTCPSSPPNAARPLPSPRRPDPPAHAPRPCPVRPCPLSSRG